MNVYFDTEFTGLNRTAQLISIGMIAGSGEKFYAEFTDFNENLCDDWVTENVVKKTYNGGNKELAKLGGELLDRSTDSWEMYEYFESGDMIIDGSSNYIRDRLTKWLSQFDKVQLVSDVCHYDMTLLCNLFGGSFNLPKNVSPVCYDICQDIADWIYDTSDEELTFEECMKKAFDISREEIIEAKDENVIKHNALWDAMVIRDVFRIVN